MISNWKQKVIQNFGSHANSYDRHNFVQEQIAKGLSDFLPEIRKPEILEVGCGTGSFTRHLIDKYENASFHITDISPEMIAQSRKNIGCSRNIEWSVMDGENPILTKKYDLIVSNMAFQWFEDSQKAIERLCSILKPDGILLYSVPSPECFAEWHCVLQELSLPSGILRFENPQGAFMQKSFLVKYNDTVDFLKTIKNVGAVTSRQGYEGIGYNNLRKACRLADERFNGKVTWNISYARVNRV